MDGVFVNSSSCQWFRGTQQQIKQLLDVITIEIGVPWFSTITVP